MKQKQKIRERTNGLCIYNPQNVEQNNKRQKSLGYQREDEDLGWMRGKRDLLTTWKFVMSELYKCCHIEKP